MSKTIDAVARRSAARLSKRILDIQDRLAALEGALEGLSGDQES